MNSYRNANGTYQLQADFLSDRVPFTGTCSNRHLERFRKASNAYYDVFNNGGGNRNASIGQFFGKEVNELLRQGNRRGGFIRWDVVAQIVDRKMDEIIVDCYSEFTAKKVMEIVDGKLTAVCRTY